MRYFHAFIIKSLFFVVYVFNSLAARLHALALTLIISIIVFRIIVIVAVNDLRHDARLDVPDFLGVLVDGSIRVELARSRRGQDGRLSPAVLVSVRLVNSFLTLDVRLEILTD